MKARALLVGIALGMIACDDNHTPTATRWVLPVRQVSAAQIVLADARQRLLPALVDKDFATNLDHAFAVAAAALDARDHDGYRAALQTAQTTMATAIAAGRFRASPTLDATDDPPVDDTPVIETLELVIELVDSAVLDAETPPP